MKLEGIMKKKILILCLCTLLFITGCSKQTNESSAEENHTENQSNNNNDSNVASFPYTDKRKAGNSFDCDDEYIYTFEKGNQGITFYRTPLNGDKQVSEEMAVIPLDNANRIYDFNLSLYYDYLIFDVGQSKYMINKNTFELQTLAHNVQQGKVLGDSLLAYSNNKETGKREYRLIDLKPLQQNTYASSSPYEPVHSNENENEYTEKKIIYGIEYTYQYYQSENQTAETPPINGTLSIGENSIECVSYLPTNSALFYVSQPLETDGKYDFSLWKCNLDGSNQEKIDLQGIEPNGAIWLINYTETHLYFGCRKSTDISNSSTTALYRIELNGNNPEQLMPELLEGEIYKFDIWGDYLYFRTSYHSKVSYSHRMRTDGTDFEELIIN